MVSTDNRGVEKNPKTHPGNFKEQQKKKRKEGKKKKRVNATAIHVKKGRGEGGPLNYCTFSLNH